MGELMKQFPSLVKLFLVLIMINNFSYSQNIERSEVPLKFKWDNSILYTNIDEWNIDKKLLESEIEKLKYFNGKMKNNSDVFYKTLRTYFDAYKLYYKISDYAFRLSDEDLRIGANQSLNQQATNLGTQLGEAASFINPEILSIEKNTINKFFNEKNQLSEFHFYVNDVLRMKEHTLSENEEKVLASAGLITTTMNEVYSIFDNAEKTNPPVKLSTGEEIELNGASYSKYRTSENREDREKVMNVMFTEGYRKYQNTFGANLAGKIRADYFYAKNRKYNTVLEQSLDVNKIPVGVYTNLVDQIHKNLPTLHRFLKLKAKMLGVDQLHYYDLYASMVKNVDFTFSIDEGQNLLLEVFKPMGEEYVSTVKRSFDERWIDYVPTKGKSSGAYSSGAAYDFHPFILMNWTDDFESLSTLAHELGHTMHSYYSNKNQPFVNAQYATFVAEIASTINETLLNDFMVKKAKNDEEKLYILGTYLDLMRSTIFRQVSFAEFEWEIHKRVENNEPLTGEEMSKIYFEIVKKYYGHDSNICIVPDYVAFEWAYIPHFIGYTYYVYQYSTSLIYATALAEKIVKEGQPAINEFYNILNGGSSDYPIELIKKAGVDPLSSEAFDIAISKMNSVMDQIESILDKK